MKTIVLIFGFAFAAIGAVFTISVLATRTSESSPFSVGVGMLVIEPATIVARLLGVEEGAHTWFWNSLAVFLNTGLCFSAGAVLGLLKYGLR